MRAWRPLLGVLSPPHQPLTIPIAGPSRTYASRSTPISSKHDARPVRDADIPYRIVQLVQPDNSLGPLQTLRSILSAYDQSTHTLTLVQDNPPIVKLVNLEDERMRARTAAAQAKLRRRAAPEEKEIQVSWTSAPGDLSHKLDLARSILERGDRVEVICAPRQGSREKFTDQRKREVFAHFAALDEVGVRWKEDDRGPKMWVGYWRPHDSLRNELQQKAVKDGVERRMEKEAKREARRKKEEERLKRAEEKRSEMLSQPPIPGETLDAP